MSRPPSSSRPSFLRHRAWRAGGAGLAFVALALAGAAAGDAARDALAASGARLPSLMASGASGLERLVRLARTRRAVVYTSVGMGLCCIPIAALGVRRRRRAREIERLAIEQQARAPEVFEAALVARPLRRSAAPPPTEPAPGDGLVPLSAEVASHAAALHAASVREAAARALLLRAASERSEMRRRAAALRGRARRDERIESAASPGKAPDLVVAPCAAAIAPETPAPLQIPANAGPAVAGATAERSAAAARPHAALLAASGPLTFEWLEQCLARDPEDCHARLDLCTSLLVAERFADAERVAREGLQRDESNGRLLLRLSEALAGLDRTQEALEVAIHAVRSHRSRKAVLHLTRLSALAHRFAPGDGPRLRKALESRPGDPVFLHAVGVFESLHGSPRVALPLLRHALRQERTPRWRRVVSREIARLRAEEIAAGVREPLRFVG